MAERFRFEFILIFLSILMHGTIKFRLSFICLYIAFVVVWKILYRILSSNERITKHSRNVENLFTDVDILWTGFQLYFADDKFGFGAGRSKVSRRHFLDRFFKFVSLDWVNLYNTCVIYRRASHAGPSAPLCFARINRTWFPLFSKWNRQTTPIYEY